MELGIFSRTYETKDLKEACRRMAGQGIFHTQLNLSSAGMATLPNRVEEKEIERIGEILREYQIKAEALSGTFNMIDPDVEARRRGCEQFRLQCRIARMLGIPVVSLCTGSKNPESKWKWHEDNERQSSWDDLMRTTETILRYAEESDVALGVEPEVSNIVSSPQKARKYLDWAGSPRLRIVMDAANLFSPRQAADMDRVLKEAFDLLGKDIVLAHAKDFSVREGEIAFAAPGEGILDFKRYARLLRKAGYGGALVIHGLSEEQVPESKKYLEEALLDAGIHT